MEILKLVNLKVQNEEYHHRLRREVVYFESFTEELKEIYQLKKEGHIIFSSDRGQSGSLFLYLMGVNLIDPIRFNIPFEAMLSNEQIIQGIHCYGDQKASKKAKTIKLYDLQVLSDLYTICQYTSINIDVLSKNLVRSKNLDQFIKALPFSEMLCARSYILQQIRPALYQCDSKDFNDLVQYIHRAYIEVYPTLKHDETLIGEIYQDLMLVVWIWTFKNLTI